MRYGLDLFNPLWEHQRTAIQRAKEIRDLQLYMDPGTGKTRVSIEILKNHYNSERRIMRTLILAPLVVVPQWKREFEKYSKVPQEKILTLHKAGPRREKDFTKANCNHPKGFIAVVNYEGACTKGLYAQLLCWRPEIIIYDEVHRCKDSSTERFKKLKPLSVGARHCYGLTGTPVLNSPIDLFAQYVLVDRGKTFGQNFFVFRATYLWDKNAGMPKHVYFPNWQPRPDAAPRLARLLSETAVQAKKEECLTLPPEVFVEIPVEMGKEQLKAYQEMKMFYVAQVKDGIVKANLAITQTLRMRQILSGFAQTADKLITFGENPRLDALVDKLKDLTLSEKVIVWCDFVPSYKLISDRLDQEKISWVCLTGQESASQKELNVAEFCEGAAQVAICNPAAVGLGIELTKASSSIYYSRSYSQEHSEQSKARNYRGGSEIHKKITRYDLVATIEGAKEPTLDRVIIDCLKNKADLAEALLNWAKL